MRAVLIPLALGLPALIAAVGVARAGDLEDARAHLESNRFRKAVPGFVAVLGASAGDKAATLGLSRAYTGMGRYDQAIPMLRGALAKSPKDRELLEEHALQRLNEARRASSNRWISAIAETRRNEASTAIDALRAAHPDSVAAPLIEARLRLLEASLELTDPSEAVELLEPVVAEHGDDFHVVYWFARAKFAVGQIERERAEAWQEAADLFTKAAELDPEDGFAPYYLARCKSWLKASAREQSKLHELALTLLPDEPSAAYATGQAIAWLSEYGSKPRKRRDISARLLEQRPLFAPLLTMNARSQAELGRPQKGEELFATSLAAAPDDPLVLVAYGDFVANTAKLPEGATDGGPHPAERGVGMLMKAIDLCGGVLDRRVYDAVDLVAIRGRMLSGEQRDRLWTKLFETYPREINAPGNAEVWWRDAGGDSKRSLEWCERALQVDPEDPMIHNDIGIGLEELERSEEAEAAYMKAITAAKKKGINHPEKSLGYLNAVRNLSELLLKEERYADLEKFANTHLKDDPRYDTIMEIIKEVTEGGGGE